MCSREHPVLVHKDSRALKLEVMEEGDLPGARVFSARGAGGLEERVVSWEQQSLHGWIEKQDKGSDFAWPELGTGSVPSFSELACRGHSWIVSLRRIRKLCEPVTEAVKGKGS